MKGSTFHICQNCHNPKGYVGRSDKRFCSPKCRRSNWLAKRKTLQELLTPLFTRIGFTLVDLAYWIEKCFDGLIKVAKLIGFKWSEWNREWVRVA